VDEKEVPKELCPNICETLLCKGTLDMDIDRSSGVLTPPLSESGDATFAGDGYPINTVDAHAPSPYPPSPASSIKSRRDRNSLQKEANRSKQFTTRLQRSATTTSRESTDLLGRKRGRSFRRQTNSLPADHGLKAIEPPHEGDRLSKMAFAEQQQWITVQQKTFTKW
jgi:hypothetical protein